MKTKAKRTRTLLILMTPTNSRVPVSLFIPHNWWAALWWPHQPVKVGSVLLSSHCCPVSMKCICSAAMLISSFLSDTKLTKWVTKYFNLCLQSNPWHVVFDGVSSWLKMFAFLVHRWQQHYKRLRYRSARWLQCWSQLLRERPRIGFQSERWGDTVEKVWSRKEQSRCSKSKNIHRHVARSVCHRPGFRRANERNQRRAAACDAAVVERIVLQCWAASDFGFLKCTQPAVFEARATFVVSLWTAVNEAGGFFQHGCGDGIFHRVWCQWLRKQRPVLWKHHLFSSVQMSPFTANVGISGMFPHYVLILNIFNEIYWNNSTVDYSSSFVMRPGNLRFSIHSTSLKNHSHTLDVLGVLQYVKCPERATVEYEHKKIKCPIFH